jgi:aminoglycoside phosphotransferase (APT) family kinase protein
MLSHDLPAGIPEWLSQIGGGEVTRLDRHIARREAWIADIKRPDGSVMEGFFRVDRAPRADDPWSLKKETGIVLALGDTAIPVPKVYGSSDQLACVLFERVPGRADLQNVAAPQQRAVMENFIDIVADMHTLDLSKLKLPDMPLPATAYDCALGEMDLVLRHWSAFVATHRDPLMTYGIDWLRRFAPKRVERISLVQGDTGPVNFMFEGNRVTAVIDWEWGHLGDPMEDLGNICVRDFWNPSGGVADLFPRYERRSGIPLDLDAVRYYRVQQQMRGMVPCACATIQAKPHEPLAWGLAYRYVGDRATCEAIAEAMGITLQLPEFPRDDGKRDPMAEAASWALSHDIAPATSTAFAKSRTNDVDVLVRCMERVSRLGPLLERIECEELGALLGKRPTNLDAGLDALDAAIKAHALQDEPVLQYLSRRAYRAEWLYLPSTELYPNRQWAPLQ